MQPCRAAQFAMTHLAVLAAPHSEIELALVAKCQGKVGWGAQLRIPVASPVNLQKKSDKKDAL